MTKTAIAAPQAVWDCHFSRPGLRMVGLADNQQPESVWVCIRTGRRQTATDAKCEACPHWEYDELKEN